MVVLGQYIDQVNKATANFAANVTDPKAQIITTYDYQQGVVCAYYVTTSSLLRHLAYIPRYAASGSYNVILRCAGATSGYL